jgi:quercetin dioxygenase-like cupin family protein
MPDLSTEWDPDLDALVAAGGHHRLLFENDAIRVLDTRIEAGETVPLHTHNWPASYYVLSFSDFVRRDGEGLVQLDTRVAGIVLRPGQAIWSAPLGPHTLENVGEQAIHLISVEVKSGL